MSRHIAREIAVRSLFQIDYNPEVAASDAIAAAVGDFNEYHAEKGTNLMVSDNAESYAAALVEGVLANKEQIDARLDQYAKEWALDRMLGTDRSILRIAAYEMLLADEKVAAGVAINEAVELAKKYGEDESPRFINGILGRLAREQSGL